MSRLGLVLAGLRHYWRTHLGTVAGMAVATATLVGALVVGDSVRHSLAERAAARVGGVEVALSTGDRFFQDSLAERLEAADERLTAVAPVVSLRGVASSSDGSARVHDVGVHGIEEHFSWFAPGPGRMADPPVPADGEAFVNRALAERLGLAAGDQLVVRVARPSALPRDVALAQDDITVALRIEVARVLEPWAFGDFDLLGGALPVPNLFLPLGWLQERIEVEGRANLLLAAGAGPDAADAALRAAWQPADAQLELRALPAPNVGAWELRTSRVFFDQPVLDALGGEGGLAPGAATGVFTYFVDSIRSGERATPYSMVAGLGPFPPTGDTDVLGRTPADDEVLLNSWEADDLGASAGDPLELEYTVVDASRRLAKRTHSFTVAGVVPLEGAAADPTLMPDFPGLADAENCRDWEPGTSVELDRIRDEDEAYWDEHHGTPKAFVTLAAARELWRSRFGELTAVRFDQALLPTVRAALTERLEPASLGLFFQDVAARAQASGESSTDFGGLFVGLSSFLIAAALLLAGQLFAFGVQQRAREAGLLAAVGFEARAVRRLFLLEALGLALVGAAVGVGLGLLYTRLVLRGLATVWSGAVASTTIGFHAEPTTLGTGGAAAVLASVATAWLVVRRELKRPARVLTAAAAGPEATAPAHARGRSVQLALVGACLAGAVAVVLAVDPASGPSAAGAFFGAGALTLTALLLGCRVWLRAASAGRRRPVRSLGALGVAGTWRRPGRSLALVALTAIGTFLVAAVGANRLGPVADETVRASGTGGFLFYGRTSLPLVQDLDSAEGRDAYLLPEDVMRDVSVVPLRVRAGEDASCLNLARPVAPRLLGVDPDELASRGAFRFASTLEPTDAPWSLLARASADGVVPAIGDATSLTWQLKKGLGDTLDYVDERGRTFQVRIVATLADTILQGDLLIAAERFQERFPTEGGHRALLVDAPPERADEVAAALTRGLGDLGLALERTGARLAAFHAVQNTYLTVFQLLGGLGLLLGSVGLGVVLLRNTLERRAELALAGALGFRAGRVRWWVVAEYGTLLALGLAVGVVAALVAVLPAMRAPASELSPLSVLGLAAAVGVAGLLWIALAARVAVQRTPLAALRVYE